MRGPGRPQEYDEDTINWNVRFPLSLHTRLHDAALERGTSMTRIVQMATTEYLDRDWDDPARVKVAP